MAYVTKSDYLDFAGIDLDLELKKSRYDNPGRAVEIFINRVEEWLRDFIDVNYQNEEIFDTTAFKKAVMHQIDYIRRNGDMSLRAVADGTRMAPNAYQVLHKAGMCNAWGVNTYYWGEADGS